MYMTLGFIFISIYMSLGVTLQGQVAIRYTTAWPAVRYRVAKAHRMP